MKYLLKSSLIALLLFSFSPASQAVTSNSPLDGNYYSVGPSGPIAVLETVVYYGGSELIGTFFFRNGEYGYFYSEDSNNGTFTGDTQYYDRTLRRWFYGEFTCKIEKSGVMIFKFNGNISTTVIALKGSKGLAPDRVVGKEFYLGGRGFYIDFYPAYAYNYYDDNYERYTYHKISANKATLTVGGTRVTLTFTDTDNDGNGRGNFTGTGSDGSSFSGNFNMYDLEDD